ncbi:MAG: TauD/TfdA family dioxygenase [Sphingopyxis sp.]
MMLWTTTINPNNPAVAFNELTTAWQANENRVFLIKGGEEIGPIQDFYTKWFGSIGTPVPLAEDATLGDREHQRTGEIWMEVRYDPSIPNAYRHSANAQPLHTDGSYIPDFPNATLLACVASADEGGDTIFIASDDVAASLADERPELFDYLTKRTILHARSGDQRKEKVIDCDHPIPLVNWNYYCLSKELNAEDRAASEAFFEFLASSPTIAAKTLPVKLSPGDAIAWKDRQVLHGRNGFVATSVSERFIWKCAIDVGKFAHA